MRKTTAAATAQAVRQTLLGSVIAAGLWGAAIAGGPAQGNVDGKFPGASATVLLHGPFGEGNALMGGSYFNDLPDWIQTAKGQRPLMPDLGKGTLDESYDIARRVIEGHCHAKPDCQVNLVGHSRGGLVGRMLMEKMPGRVASLTMVGTPNRGTFLADAIDRDEQVRADFERLTMGQLKVWMPQLKALSPDAMKAFNSKYPWGVDADLCARTRRDAVSQGGVAAGVVAKIAGRDGVFHDIPVVAILSTRRHLPAYLFGEPMRTWDEKLSSAENAEVNAADPLYAALERTGAFGSHDARFGSDNDGIVPVCSAQLAADGADGMARAWVLSALDHGDQMQQLAGQSSRRGYLAVAAYLAGHYERQAALIVDP